MIRAITFDWGDTLAVNYGMPYLATQRRAFSALATDLKALGCPVPEEFTAQAMAGLAVEWRKSIDPARNPEHREFDFATMLRGWVLAAGGDALAPTALAQVIDACTDRLADTMPPLPESQPVLAALKGRGFRIGILSHVPWPGDACRRWFVRHGLAPYVDFYSLSCEVGWIKPNVLHYQDAQAQAGCPAQEILHVGDHPFRDVEGGRKFGFKTVLRRTECIYPEEALDACRPDAEIIRLEELPGLLDRW